MERYHGPASPEAWRRTNGIGQEILLPPLEAGLYKVDMRKQGILISAGFLMVAVLGCGGIVHPETNVVLPGTRPQPEVETAPGDTVVVAMYEGTVEYAVEKTNDVNWRRHWNLSKYKVLRVERGHWPDETVHFVFDYHWPTIESGIMLRVAPDDRFPHGRRGTVWALNLDTCSQPAKLVGFSQRSVAPPYD